MTSARVLLSVSGYTYCENGIAVLLDIRDYGFDARGCDFRQIDGKLWEIKIRAPGGGYRFFYFMAAPDHMHVLHAYKKQGKKTPMKELEVARRRLREALNAAKKH